MTTAPMATSDDAVIADLLAKAEQVLAARLRPRADHLQRDEAIQLEVPRLVDDAHRPSPQLCQDFVARYRGEPRFLSGSRLPQRVRRHLAARASRMRQRNRRVVAGRFEVVRRRGFLGVGVVLPALVVWMSF